MLNCECFGLRCSFSCKHWLDLVCIGTLCEYLHKFYMLFPNRYENSVYSYGQYLTHSTT